MGLHEAIPCLTCCWTLGFVELEQHTRLELPIGKKLYHMSKEWHAMVAVPLTTNTQSQYT
jgi:hypothetical protein